MSSFKQKKITKLCAQDINTYTKRQTILQKIDQSDSAIEDKENSFPHFSYGNIFISKSKLKEIAIHHY